MFERGNVPGCAGKAGTPKINRAFKTFPPPQKKFGNEQRPYDLSIRLGRIDKSDEHPESRWPDAISSAGQRVMPDGSDAQAGRDGRMLRKRFHPTTHRPSLWLETRAGCLGLSFRFNPHKNGQDRHKKKSCTVVTTAQLFLKCVSNGLGSTSNHQLAVK